MRGRLLIGAVLLMWAGSAVAQNSATSKPRWIADPKTGCRIWNSIPEPNESISWSGSCQNQIAQGRGVLQWFKDGHANGRYEGEFRDGKENGRGVFTAANDDRYDGEWREGKQKGRGVWMGADGDRYDGEWRDGRKNGRGVYTKANGNRYEGEFSDGKAKGRGAFTWLNGDRYEGEFRDDKPNGLGSLQNSNGTFNGVWTNGCFKDGDRRAWVGVPSSSCP